MVVYADILLALNWWIDFLLLMGVGRMLNCRRKPWRLALGSLVGGISSFVLLLPPMPVWLSLAFKLVAAAGMVLVAFPWGGSKNFLRQLFLLFGLSAGLAGLCGALYFFAAPGDFYVSNGVVYYGVPPLLLVGLTVVSYGILWGAEVLMRRRAPAGLCCRIRITVEGHSTQLNCLYDSGNHLVEPFSGRPVLVVERAVAAELTEVPASAEELPAHSPAGWRLVPYDTLGGGGLLPAFMPKEVTALLPRGERVLPPCYVAVCDRLGRGEYSGLIGSALGEYIMEGGK